MAKKTAKKPSKKAPKEEATTVGGRGTDLPPRADVARVALQNLLASSKDIVSMVKTAPEAKCETLITSGSFEKLTSAIAEAEKILS
jgi:hypothetical protein